MKKNSLLKHVICVIILIKFSFFTETYESLYKYELMPSDS